MKKTIWVKDKACFACPVRSSKFCIVKTKEMMSVSLKVLNMKTFIPGVLLRG